MLALSSECLFLIAANAASAGFLLRRFFLVEVLPIGVRLGVKDDFLAVVKLMCGTFGTEVVTRQRPDDLMSEMNETQ